MVKDDVETHLAHDVPVLSRRQLALLLSVPYELRILQLVDALGEYIVNALLPSVVVARVGRRCEDGVEIE